MILENTGVWRRTSSLLLLRTTPFLKCTVSRRPDECFRIQCVELLRSSFFSLSKDEHDPSKITAVAEPENLRELSGETIFVKVLCKPKVPLIAVRFFLGGGGEGHMGNSSFDVK